jgi:membrane associated rhomboid family serine protease
MSYAFTPNLSAGASTAIFGLVGAEMALSQRAQYLLAADCFAPERFADAAQAFEATLPR